MVHCTLTLLIMKTVNKAEKYIKLNVLRLDGV